MLQVICYITPFFIVHVFIFLGLLYVLEMSNDGEGEHIMLFVVYHLEENEEPKQIFLHVSCIVAVSFSSAANKAQNT